MTRRLALALAFSIAGTASAQGRALTIEDYYRVQTVGTPQLSPDGKWVGYTVSMRVEATNGDSTEVWMAAADGSTAPRRVGAPGQVTAVEWTEDARLAWRSRGRRWSIQPSLPDSITELPVVAPQGGRAVARLLTSPNGRQVAVLRNVGVAARATQYASDFEKRHEERFRGVQFDWLDFQRDGQPFPVPNRADPFVTPPQELWVGANADSARQITRLGLRPTGIEWNKSGSALVFSADSAYRNERVYGADQIFVASTDGSVRMLTTDKTVDHTEPHFSPDGRWVLYTRQLSTDYVIAQKLDHGGPTDLAIIPAAGGAEKIVTATWDYLPSNASWSPDGKWIYFTGGVGGTTHLFRVSPDGGDVQQVTKGERRIGGISFDREYKRIAYTVGTIEAPAEIWTANVDGSNERRITHVHDAITSEIAFSKAERLQFGSKDGTPVEGWLLYPFGYRPNGGPYPLVVSNHGGPHSADGYAFDFKSQYFAANGYFVLKVNFRSSTGYGEKFLWGTWGAWGDRDGEDVMAGVDQVLATKPIARNRVATIGHSYGGFMTNWLITQYPDRFAAAIPGAGIVNWVSDYGTADIARTKETEFYGTPWDERARNIMIRQSPLTYANRVKAPTLFIHGEVDQRVPYSEAEQFFVALKKNGIPAKVIQYQGMPHGITGSWNVVHRMLNELRWLNTYLGAPGA